MRQKIRVVGERIVGFSIFINGENIIFFSEKTKTKSWSGGILVFATMPFLLLGQAPRCFAHFIFFNSFFEKTTGVSAWHAVNFVPSTPIRKRVKRHLVAKNVQPPSYWVRRRDLFIIVRRVWAHGSRRLADARLFFFPFLSHGTKNACRSSLFMFCAFQSLVFWYFFHHDFFYRNFDLFQFGLSIEIDHIFCFFIMTLILLIFCLILIPLI